MSYKTQMIVQELSQYHDLHVASLKQMDPDIDEASVSSIWKRALDYILDLEDKVDELENELEALNEDPLSEASITEKEKIKDDVEILGSGYMYRGRRLDPVKLMVFTRPEDK